MPSMRPHPLNPRAPAVPEPAAAPAPVAAPVEPSPQAPTRQNVSGAPVRMRDTPPPAGADSAAEESALRGGFHESSYELTQGLQITESDWPDDITLPGGLDER
jgi:hypothetical protein